MKDKILNMLGFGARARSIVTGTDMTISEMEKGNIKIIFIANDIAQNSKEKIIKTARKMNVKTYDFFNTEELSSAIGKMNRVVVGVKDDQMARGIKEYVGKM
jgi:ribosomal protein L7Ae-like RNA K-turn-binding protein